jgi:flagellar basal body-associated protein FliL
VNQDAENRKKDKKKLAILTVLALVIFAGVSTAGFLFLSKMKGKAAEAAANTSQEQFAGQAETSQQLQSECQASANTITKSNELRVAIDEFKKHVDSCREVYFTSEEKTEYRNEGMYPDLSVDILTKLASTDKNQAMDFLAYLKKLQPWQYYMGPVVCDSQSILNAYEESIKSADQKICVKAEEFNDKIYNSLKNKNFSVLASTLGNNQVAWLGSANSDLGCPERISSIVKAVESAAGNSQIRPVEQKQESTGMNVIFRNGAEEDSVVLEFGDVKGCVELRSAAVSNLQVNE